MELVREAVSLWLKLMVPLPDPKARVGAVMVPATSLPPRAPMLIVPTEPLEFAMMIPVEVTDPPFARVSVPPPR